MKKKSGEAHKEIVVINDKKHRAKLEIASIKNKMLQEIEEFAGEMDKAKTAIGENQANILTSIRDRLSTTAGTNPSAFPTGVRNVKTDEDRPRENHFANNQAHIAELLQEINVTNLAELIQKLQASEEQVFSLYRTIQSKNAEVEIISMDNKQVESDLEIQTKKLDDLQSHNNQVKNDLEQNIATIQKAIAKYEQDYGAHLEVLSSISENLMNLLRNVSR